MQIIFNTFKIDCVSWANLGQLMFESVKERLTETFNRSYVDYFDINTFSIDIDVIAREFVAKS